jgi:hypothetical protein
VVREVRRNGGDVNDDASAKKPVNTPARNYSWPPFEKGNLARLTHGARSARIYTPIAQDITAATRPHAPWWTPADEPTVQAWAIEEARAQLLRLWLADRGSEIDDETADVVGVSKQLDRIVTRCESLRSKLGLDPLSRARLGRDVAQGAAAASAAQRMADEAKRLAAEADR